MPTSTRDVNFTGQILIGELLYSSLPLEWKFPKLLNGNPRIFIGMVAVERVDRCEEADIKRIRKLDKANKT
jgi:hypothetical protein